MLRSLLFTTGVVPKMPSMFPAPSTKESFGASVIPRMMPVWLPKGNFAELNFFFVVFVTISVECTYCLICWNTVTIFLTRNVFRLQTGAFSAYEISKLLREFASVPRKSLFMIRWHPCCRTRRRGRRSDTTPRRRSRKTPKTATVAIGCNLVVFCCCCLAGEIV